MEVAFEVKNMSRAFKPKQDDILIYDGKTWYITTRKELFKEYETHFDEKIAECNEKIREMNETKAEIAQQMLEFGEVIKQVVLKEGE